MVDNQVRFEELTVSERKLLLRALDYDVDKDGYVLTPSGSKIPSDEIPGKFLNVESSAFIAGSLKVIDGTPTSISKFIREQMV